MYLFQVYYHLRDSSPQNDNSVIIYSPSVSFFWSQDILKNVGNKYYPVAIDFSKEINTMEVNGYQQLFGDQHSSKYLFEGE